MAKRPLGTGVLCFFFDVNDGKRCQKSAGAYVFCPLQHHQDRWKLLHETMQEKLNGLSTNTAWNKDRARWDEAYEKYREGFAADQLSDAYALGMDFVATTAEQVASAGARLQAATEDARRRVQGKQVSGTCTCTPCLLSACAVAFPDAPSVDLSQSFAAMLQVNTSPPLALPPTYTSTSTPRLALGSVNSPTSSRASTPLAGTSSSAVPHQDLIDRLTELEERFGDLETTVHTSIKQLVEDQVKEAIGTALIDLNNANDERFKDFIEKVESKRDDLVKLGEERLQSPTTTGVSYTSAIVTRLRGR